MPVVAEVFGDMDEEELEVESPNWVVGFFLTRQAMNTLYAKGTCELEDIVKLADTTKLLGCPSSMGQFSHTHISHSHTQFSHTHIVHSHTHIGPATDCADGVDFVNKDGVVVAAWGDNTSQEKVCCDVFALSLSLLCLSVSWRALSTLSLSHSLRPFMCLRCARASIWSSWRVALGASMASSAGKESTKLIVARGELEEPTE